jgi:hypothetical protein
LALDRRNRTGDERQHPVTHINGDRRDRLLAM